MPTIERVAAFDTYGFNANDDAFRVTLWIGNVLVLENLRTAILIIDRSLHCSSPITGAIHSTIAE